MLGIPSNQHSEMNKFKCIVCETGARTDVQNYLIPTHKIHLKWKWRVNVAIGWHYTGAFRVMRSNMSSVPDLTLGNTRKYRLTSTKT